MVATRTAIDSANRTTFLELERDRRRRTRLVLIGILLALVGWRLAVRVPAGQYGLGSFPNIIEYQGEPYSYYAGTADDPPAECAGATDVPDSLRQVGHITDVTSDSTASLGHVLPGDGPPVFAATSGTGADGGSYSWRSLWREGGLFAHASPGCYIHYTLMP
jgi:hypothetical protein